MAINSMFKWYNEAEICLAYLKDVDDVGHLHDSVWFTRGWTLQELLAPAKVEFLSADWQHIGYKHEIVEKLSQITNISAAVLSDGSKARESTLDEVRHWMSGRETTFDEDRAYCLLGILDIDMRISYGGKKAMSRLDRKYYKSKAQPSTSLDATAAQVADETCARFCWLAEQLEKLSRHIQKSCDGEMPLALSKLRITGRALAAALRGYDLWHRRGSIDITLFIQCARSLTHNIDTDTLISDITYRVARLCQARKIDEIDAIADELPELLQRAKHMLDHALDLYSSMQDKRDFMPILVAEAYKSVPFIASLFHTSKDQDPIDDKTGSPVVQGTRHQPLTGVSSSSGTRSKGKLCDMSSRFRWLSDVVLHIAMRRDQGLWQVQLSTSRQVPEGSPIFKLCEHGDIEGMKQLIAQGQASVMDHIPERTGRFPDETLLSRAALLGHIEICRYLLAHPAWKDRASEASYALSVVGTAPVGDDTMVIICRLFVEQYGLELDVSRDGSEYDSTGWLIWALSRTQAYRDVILKSIFPPWSQRTVRYRFEQSMELLDPSAQDFLSLTGLEANDHRWTTLKGQAGDKAGWTILHFLAVVIARIEPWRSSIARVQDCQEWCRLGSDLLQNGMAPHAINHEHCTALISGLKALERVAAVRSPDELHTLSQRIDYYMRAWQDIVEGAKLDFQSFLEEENVLLSIAKPELYALARGLRKMMRIVKLDFTKEDGYDMQLLYSTELDVLVLVQCPGEFPSREPVTRTIFWCPTDEELREGHWTRIKTFNTRPALVHTRSFLTAAHDAMDNIIEAMQDDAGIISLLSSRMRRPKPSSKRSNSHEGPWFIPGFLNIIFAPEMDSIALAARLGNPGIPRG